MLGPEAVARRAAELRNIGAQDFDDAFLGSGDTGQEAQKGGLAGTGGTNEKQPLSAFEDEVFNDEAECVAAGPRRT